MGLIQLLVLLAVIGVMVWLIVTYIPMPQSFRRIIIAVAVIVVCIYLLSLFGLLPDMNAIRVGK